MMLYEMASGYQPSDIARVTIPPCALLVQNALQAIFHPRAAARGSEDEKKGVGLSLGQALSLELFASAEHLMPAPGMDMDKVSRLKRRLKRSVAETPAPGEPPDGELEFDPSSPPPPVQLSTMRKLPRPVLPPSALELRAERAPT